MIMALGFLLGTLGLAQADRPAAVRLPTDLPIGLVGVVVNRSSPERSVCLLRQAETGGQPILAGPGDTVFGLAVVHEIGPEAVVLANLARGELEILSFWKTKRPPPLPPAPAPKSDLVPADDPPVKEIVLPKSVVDHYRANLKEFMDAATAGPRVRTVDGRSVIDGFQIQSVKKGSIVEQIGFLAGDVIVEVNGVKLDGLDKVLGVYQKFKDASSVELLVLRGGKTRTVSFSQK